MLDPRELPDNAFSRIFRYLETGEYEDQSDDEVSEDEQDESSEEEESKGENDHNK